MKTKQLIEGLADVWAVQWLNPKTGSMFYWDGSEWVTELDRARTYAEAEARRLVANMLDRSPKLADSVGVVQLPVEQYKARFGPERFGPLRMEPATRLPRRGTFGEPPRKGIFGVRELRGRFGSSD